MQFDDLHETSAPAVLQEESAIGGLDPTRETYGDLQRAAEIYNRELFDGKLPNALITLRATGRSLGYFSADRFVNTSGRRVHEIALNAEAFSTHTIEDNLSTLAHELVHMLQHVQGTAPRAAYHNKQFADIMEEIGLIASSTGRPGGKRVGQQMSHFIEPSGRFLRVTRALVDEGFRARWGDRFVRRLGNEYIGPVDGDASEEVESDTPGILTLDSAGPSTATGAAAYNDGHFLDALREKAHPGGEPAPIAKITDAFVKVVTKIGQREKYACPGCKNAAWGKPGMHLRCGDCDQPLFATLGLTSRSRDELSD
jgi:hypothetical protein